MLVVKKANRVLKIDEAEKAAFLKNGYAVIDENTGKVKETAPTKESKLADELKKVKAENAKLKAEIAELKKEK